MKDFLKTVLASALGCTMAFIFMSMFLSVMILVMAVGLAFMSTGKQKSSYTSLKDKTVLMVNIEGPLTERREYNDVVREVLYDDQPKSIGLYELEKSLKLAAKDKRIKGLYLRLRWLSGGWGKVEAVRKMLKNFKTSGKFIYAYSEAYNEKLYYLATVADEIFMYPKGDFEWNGIYTKLSFFKKTLAKLEVVPTLIRAGKYKSAGEMIIRENMSEPNREQITSLNQSLWGHILKTVSESRKDLSAEKLDTIAKDLLVQDAQQAYNNNLVTELVPIEEVEKKLLKVTGVKDDEPRLITWRGYLESEESTPFLRNKDRVAVVVANGEILLGRGSDEERIYSDNLSLTIRELSKEEKVKAVVLRVNSPGGSALASDVIWNSLEYLKQKNKKLVASFSDVAASGGYYIAAGSDYIFAEPTTVTGSIGVFGMLFDTSKFFDHKIGMTFDEVKSHPSADMMTGRALTQFEKRKIQSSVDSIYKTFLYVVQQGRKGFQSEDEVKDVAEGRVWAGTKALELGLVDGLGSLNEAVLKAAELAQLKNYEVVVYPDQKRWIDKVLETLGESWMPDWYSRLMTWLRPQRQDKIYTRLPYVLDIN